VLEKTVHFTDYFYEFEMDGRTVAPRTLMRCILEHSEQLIILPGMCALRHTPSLKTKRETINGCQH
jgi:hypothetical protein